MDLYPEIREARRAAIRNLFPQRRSPYCRRLLLSTLSDCRALERPFGRHDPLYQEQLRRARLERAALAGHPA